MTTQKLPPPVSTRVVYVDVDPDDPAAVAAANAALNEMFNAQADPQPRLAQLLEETLALLPDRLKRDNYWLPCALIFRAVFPGLIPVYFDFAERLIDIPRFNEKQRGLSHGEAVLVDLAFHLFNDNNPLPNNSLLGLRALDNFHFELAMLAIRLAHHSAFAPWEKKDRL